MKNKFGVINIGLIVGIVAALILVVSLFATGVLASSTIPSLNEKSPEYNKKTCPDLGVNIAGVLNIEDSAIFDLEPSIAGIDVEEVKVSGKSILAFGVEPFTYTVKGFNVQTNQKLGATFEGSGQLRGSDNEGIDKAWSLSFKIPDHNCDGKIDDFDLKITAELKGEDIGDVAEYSGILQFRDGGIKKWD